MLAAVAGYGLDTQSYFELEIKAMELTVQSYERQLECCQRGCSDDELQRIRFENHQKTGELFTRYGTTGGKWLAYYTRHRAELDPLYKNSEWARQLDELRRRLEELDQQLQTCGKE